MTVFHGFEPESESFRLRGQRAAILLDAEGIHHPRSHRGGGRVFTPYQEVTHLARSRRTLWLGAKASVYALSRRIFVDSEAPERLVNSLLRRVGQRPDGSERLASMARIEELSQAPSPLRATWTAVAACLVVFALQLGLDPVVYEVGYFSPVLFNDGDLWRAVTANLIHGIPEFPLHLLLNMAGLIAVGALLERPLGSWRTAWVMGVSVFGAMAGSALAGYSAVVGASGVVFGLAGGLLWLELRCADQLPAWWRLPRRPFLVILVVNAAIMVLIPLIATAAHVGGFLAGWIATAAVARPALRRASPSAWVRLGGAIFALLAALSAGTAAERVLREEDFVASHARRLAGLPGVSPGELNDRAWMIAIAPDPSPLQIEAALALAERAVTETGRSEPTILDTLAEVQFVLGWKDSAIATIDEAIAQAPDQPYYREQRRRFTGERPAADRPDYPLLGAPAADGGLLQGVI
jgi:membrane associated rhomboid family serine protease